MEINPIILSRLLDEDLGVQVDPLRLFRANALRASLLKKYVPPGGEADRLRAEALADFAARNDELKKFVISDAFFSSQLFHDWKERLHRDFHSGPLQACLLTLNTCVDNGKQGPGAVVGPDSTLFFTKMFDSDMTTTSAFLHEHYTHNIGLRWSAAESYRRNDYAVKVVTGSKMSTVRKNADKDRTTCKEPTLNMFYQLGAKHVIESILRTRYNLDVRRNRDNRATQQDINRALARQASIDGLNCTIDMTNASDSTLVALCERLLSKDVWRVLDKIRCHVTHIPKIGTRELAMVSTMGNGFTFALMTLLFTSLIKCIHESKQLPYQNGVHGGVYGDDIIVSNSIASELIEVLTTIGYTVNKEKSYFTGSFRESCGGDYMDGHDVRGIYIQDLSHETHRYSAFNRLHLWSVKHSFHLHATLRYLHGTVKHRPIPLDQDVSSGILCPADYANAVIVKQNVNPKRVNVGGARYEYLKPVPAQVNRCGERFTNFHGGLISFLGGFVRDDSMNLRVNNPQFIVAQSTSSSWDWSPFPWLDAKDLGWYFHIGNFAE